MFRRFGEMATGKLFIHLNGKCVSEFGNCVLAARILIAYNDKIDPKKRIKFAFYPLAERSILNLLLYLFGRVVSITDFKRVDPRRNRQNRSARH